MVMPSVRPVHLPWGYRGPRWVPEWKERVSGKAGPGRMSRSSSGQKDGVGGRGRALKAEGGNEKRERWAIG